MDPENHASLIDVFPLENGNMNDAARSDSRHASENAVRHAFNSTSEPEEGRSWPKVGPRVYEGR